MLEFDSLKFTFRCDGQEVALPPLSFKLLQKLAQHKNEIVDLDDLLTSVWGDTVVSPETLKQRIFLLKKSLNG